MAKITILVPSLRLTGRLFAAFVVLAAIVIGAMVLSATISLNRGFSAYLLQIELAELDPLADAARAEYARHGFDQFARNPQRWAGFVGGSLPPPPLPPPPLLPFTDGRPPPPLPRLVPSPRVSLLDADMQLIIGPPEALDGPRRLLRGADGRVIGALALMPTTAVGREVERAFFRAQRRQLVMMAALSFAIAAAFAWALSRALLRPLRDINAATTRIAAGDFAVRLVPHRADELGDLARDISLMAQSLGETEAARRRWVADTSHELRTPLSVLRGMIEAVQDGVRDADAVTLATLHGQVMQLTRLAGDLGDLARADSGAVALFREPGDLVKIVDDVVGAWREGFARSGISLDLCKEQSALPVVVDRGRIIQVLTNVLANTQRYTDSAGLCRITVRCDATMAIVRIDDSAPGVPPAALPKLFDRFYRVEESRGRAGGGAGLGLAIAAAIIGAHGGTIVARASDLGGLCVIISLPLGQLA